MGNVRLAIAAGVVAAAVAGPGAQLAAGAAPGAGTTPARSLASSSTQLNGAVQTTVQPGLTGAGITPENTAAYYDWVWTAAPANRLGVLVVVLGGSNSWPGIYSQFGNVAAEDGFDVIDLRYPDGGISIGPLCALHAKGETEDECDTNAHGADVFGEGSDYGLTSGVWNSPDLHVDEANSVVNRLVALLGYLGWSQYLQSAPGSPYGGMVPLWSQIVVVGHSGGAGEAAFLATHIDVRRVVTVSGPPDYVTVGGQPQPESWITEPSATPASSFYGFTNTLDGTWSGNELANWNALGYPGPMVDVDTTPAPYDDSHQLYTTAPAAICTASNCNTLEYHCEPIANIFTPLALGSPVLAPVWTYLITGGGAD